MLTQEQLAGLTGVTLSFIGHIERGTRAVSVETLARLCKALEMDMHYIVFGDFSGSSVNSDLLNDLRELLKNIEHIHPDYLLRKEVTHEEDRTDTGMLSDVPCLHCHRRGNAYGLHFGRL